MGNSYGVFRRFPTIYPQMNLGVMHSLLLAEYKKQQEGLNCISPRFFSEAINSSIQIARRAYLSRILDLSLRYVQYTSDRVIMFCVKILSRIEKEQELVNANKQLIELFEQKIKDRIAKVWGK